MATTIDSLSITSRQSSGFISSDPSLPELVLEARELTTKSVVVYLDRAELKRSILFRRPEPQAPQLPVRMLIRVNNVSPMIARDSIRVDGQNGVLILDVNYAEMPQFCNEECNKVQQQLSDMELETCDLESHCAAINDQIEVLQRRLEVLDGVAKQIGKNALVSPESTPFRRQLPSLPQLCQQQQLPNGCVATCGSESALQQQQAQQQQSSSSTSSASMQFAPTSLFLMCEDSMRNLTSFLDYYAKSASDTRRELRQKGKELAELKERLAKSEWELNKQRGKLEYDKNKRAINLLVEMQPEEEDDAEGGSEIESAVGRLFELHLVYQVFNCGWKPCYSLRASSSGVLTGRIGTTKRKMSRAAMKMRGGTSAEKLTEEKEEEDDAGKFVEEERKKKEENNEGGDRDGKEGCEGGVLEKKVENKRRDSKQQEGGGGGERNKQQQLQRIAEEEDCSEAILLSFHGMVEQNTDEDWRDAHLILSTAQPCSASSIPSLPSLNAMLQRTVISGFRQRNLSSATARHRRALNSHAASQEDLDAGIGSFDYNELVDAQHLQQQIRAAAIGTSVHGSGSENSSIHSLEHTPSTYFPIDSPCTIPSDGQRHKVDIAHIELLPTYWHECVPSRMTSTFLNAKLINCSPLPLLPGPLSVFFNNSFVATSNLKLVLPGEEFRCLLGVDPSIKVEYKRAKTTNEQFGFMTKKSLSTHEQAISLRNAKANQSVQVTIREPIPKAVDEQVKVALVHPDLKAQRTECRLTKEHNLEWTVKLAPGEQRELVVKWTAEYPAQECVLFTSGNSSPTLHIAPTYGRIH